MKLRPKHLFLNLGLCILIGLTIKLFLPESSLTLDLSLSLITGLSIHVLIIVASAFTGSKNLKQIISAVMIGTTGGILIQFFASYYIFGLTNWFLHEIFLITLLITILLSIALSAIFIGHEKILLLEHSLTKSKLGNLRSTVESHFLFNTLSNLRSMIRMKDERAIELLDSLNALFRASLSGDEKVSHSLEEEITLVEHYLNIMQIRLGERLRFDIRGRDNLPAVTVPKFMLQPIVENSVKHGIEPSSETGIIEITFTPVKSHQLIITIRDNGIGPAPGYVYGVGLSNTVETVNLFFAGKATFEMNRDHSGWTETRITLPVKP